LRTPGEIMKGGPVPAHDSPRPLPERPDLRHLKDQARDLHRSGETATLAAAQLRIARLYGFPSWPKLKAHVESLKVTGRLREAIDRNDLAAVRDMMTRSPALHRAPLGYGEDGPLTWVAECRVPAEPPSRARLEMARWMIEHGSDVHQGGDGPLMRAALADARIPMMELLVVHGADVNALWHGFYPILCAPCETLAAGALRWLFDHGADPHLASPEYGTPLSMVLATYGRNPTGRGACLEAFAERGLPLPDTPPMALHRRRLDLLEEHLRRDPGMLRRTWTEPEIYPPELGLNPGDGLCATPIAGGTLLHLAIEYDDLETAEWLVRHGADVNARAALDEDGFEGHTPLFHAVVSLGRRDDAKARFLLERGADPSARATLRKQLRHMGDPERERMHEFRDVTPLGYAALFQEPAWAGPAALNAVREYGGRE
jgi:ankyrin repeat protein